ncbi:MAG: aquaporin [Actinomycetota bacterium]
MDNVLVRKGAAEFVGTALLLGAAIGGGQAATATGAPPHIALLIATMAAAATLFTVLHAIGPVSGGHVNPAVSISMLATRNLSPTEAIVYVAAQVSGGILGATGANAVWDVPLVAGPGSGSGTLSTASYGAEIIATCALVGAIHAAVRGGNDARLPMIVPAAVIAGSFAAPFGMANPAVTLAAGIVGDAMSIGPILVLVALELASAVAVARAVALLYGKLASQAAEQKAFEVTLDRTPTVELDVVTDAIKAAIRENDSVLRTADGGWRVVLHDASDEVVEAVRQRVSAFVELAIDVTQGPGAGPVVNLVPVPDPGS